VAPGLLMMRGRTRPFSLTLLIAYVAVLALATFGHDCHGPTPPGHEVFSTAAVGAVAETHCPACAWQRMVVQPGAESVRTIAAVPVPKPALPRVRGNVRAGADLPCLSRGPPAS
jgi:hypothetical protein